MLLTQAVGLEQLPPGHHLRPALEQRPTLAFRHTAPHPELGLVVQGVGKALGDNRAPDAHLLGDLLGSTPDEQGAGLNRTAGSVLAPLPRGMSCRCYTLAMRHGDGHVVPLAVSGVVPDLITVTSSPPLEVWGCPVVEGMTLSDGSGCPE